jgi:hypothetical protein
MLAINLEIDSSVGRRIRAPTVMSVMAMLITVISTPSPGEPLTVEPSTPEQPSRLQRR